MTEPSGHCTQTLLPRRKGPATAARSRPAIRDATQRGRALRRQVRESLQGVSSQRGAESGRGPLGTSRRHRLSQNSVGYDSCAHRKSPASVRTIGAEGDRSWPFGGTGWLAVSWGCPTRRRSCRCWSPRLAGRVKDHDLISPALGDTCHLQSPPHGARHRRDLDSRKVLG